MQMKTNSTITVLTKPNASYFPCNQTSPNLPPFQQPPVPMASPPWQPLSLGEDLEDDVEGSAIVVKLGWCGNQRLQVV